MVFIFSAVAMMLTGRVYSYFEHKQPFKKLLPFVLTIIVAITILVWLLFFIKGFVILPIILFIVFRIIYLLSNLEFWGISSIVFDVRQGKRLFGLISSGDMPAKLLGYLSVYLFVPIIGLQSLLIIAATAFGISRFFLQRIFQHPEYSQKHVEHTKKLFSDKDFLKTYFGNDFIFSLALLGFLTAVAIAIIEYAFLSNVKTKYHTQEDLAAFLSIFLVIGYSITLIIKLLFSGRFSARVGIKRSLLAMPVIVILISLAFYYLEFRDYSLHDSLIFISFLFISTSIVRYSINDPIFLVLFQPLQTQMRLKGHTIIKGFVQPLALGVVGIVLWLIKYFTGTVNFSYLNLGLLIVGILWFFSISYSNKKYLLTLGEAIRKRFISGTDLGVADESYFKLLQKKLHSEFVEEVIYAVSMLEKTNIDLLKEECAFLLKHKNDIVLEYVIMVIGKNNWREFSEPLYQIYDTTPDENMKALAVKVYCQLSTNVTQDFLNSMETKSSLLQTAFLTGLINSGNSDGKEYAELKLRALCNSEIDLNKIIATQIIGERKDESHFDLILKFLNDKNVSVQREAIIAAGKIKNKLLVPSLFDLLDNKELKRDVIIALSNLEDAPALEINSRLKVNSIVESSLYYEYIKILENAPGEEAVNTFFVFLKDTSIDVRIWVLSALNNMEFNTTKVRTSILNDILNDEFHYAYWILHEFHEKTSNTRLRDSLKYEIDLCKNRIFLCLGLLYNREIVKKAQAALNVASKEKKANALEVLDQIIPRKIHDYLVALSDNISLTEKLSKLKIFVIKDNAPVPLFILRKGKMWFSNWTIAAALSCIEINKTSFFEIFNYLKDENAIVQQSALEILTKYKVNNLISFNELLTTFNLVITEQDMIIDQRDQRLSDIEKVIVLKSTALFGGTPENIIAEIVGIVKEEFVVKDDVIFKKGDSGSSMYIIFQGEVKIHDGDNVFAILGSHNFFGELALLDPEPRSASATATADTLLLKLNEEDAYELMEERIEVLKSIMRILCKRIRLQNTEMTMKKIGSI